MAILATSSITTAPGLVPIDPIQALVDYVNIIKPYHTKIFEVDFEFVYTEYIKTIIVDTMNLSINSIEGESVDVTITEFIETIDFNWSGNYSYPTVTPAAIPGVINLASAVTYAVGAFSTITNTATPTAITGNLFLTPGSSVTNFPPGTVSGIQNIDNPAAVTAMNDATAAFVAGNLLTPFNTIPAELGGTSPAPGYYTTGSSFQITGTLTLNGNAGSVWVFKSPSSTLTTAVSSSVVLTGGALPQNVYWLVGSSATIGVSSTFVGTVLAQASITVNTTATVTGHLFALTGAVTFDDNTLVVTPAGSASNPDQITVAGNITTALQIEDLTELNGMPYTIVSFVFDPIHNQTIITLNTAPTYTVGQNFIVQDIDISPWFQFTIISVNPVDHPPSQSPNLFARTNTNNVILGIQPGIVVPGVPSITVLGNATVPVQPGMVFQIQGSPSNNGLYYAVYVQYEPIANTTTIGVGSTTGVPIPVLTAGGGGMIVPYRFIGEVMFGSYDHGGYDAGPYDESAGSIIHLGP